MAALTGFRKKRSPKNASAARTSVGRAKRAAKSQPATATAEGLSHSGRLLNFDGCVPA